MKNHFALPLILCLFFSTLSEAQEPGVVYQDSRLKLVYDKFQLADGAGWDGRSRLFVPDVKDQKLYLFSLNKPKEAPRVVLDDARISGCCFQKGQLYVSDNGNARIAVLTDDRKLKTLAQFENDQRPNDLAVDVAGNVYVTFTREGVVRRITEQGRADVVVEGLTAPNGIGLSPDGSTMYVSSVKTGLISSIPVGADTIPWKANDFAQLEETKDGFRGDGMCLDRAGNVYITGAEAVSVFSPGGKLIDKIKTPERPINAIIGGVEGWTLFVSTFGGLYSQRVNAYGVSPEPAAMDLSKTPTTTAVIEVQSDLNVVYANDGDRKLLMDVFSPKTYHRMTRPAIVVVHGGGWMKGDKTKFRQLALRLARLGWVTAAIEYRLAFEAKFPAAIRDCNAATSFLRENADRWRIDPKRIGAVGGSAGGHLVGLMAAGADNEKLRHGHVRGSSHLKAAVVMAGPLQIATGSVAERSHKIEGKANAIHWIGDTIDELPAMYHLADAHEKIGAETPPILFVSGSLDNPERNAVSREALEKAGVVTKLIVHEEAKHGHWNRPDWIGTVVKDIDTFLADHL